MVGELANGHLHHVGAPPGHHGQHRACRGALFTQIVAGMCAGVEWEHVGTNLITGEEVAVKGRVPMAAHESTVLLTMAPCQCLWLGRAE